jgi:hypothetical protein
MSLDLEREYVVQQLCAAYAAERLSEKELETRFELVYAARDPAGVRAALSGLTPTAPGIHPTPTYRRPSGAVAAPEREKRYLALFSEIKKDGVWSAPPFARVRAIFGTVVIDLREADIPVDGMIIDAEATLGEVKIFLPLGVGCEVDCTSVLGEVKDKTQPGQEGLPFVRVRGGAVLGTILVQTKLPKKERMAEWRQAVRGWIGDSERLG